MTLNEARKSQLLRRRVVRLGLTRSEAKAVRELSEAHKGVRVYRDPEGAICLTRRAKYTPTLREPFVIRRTPAAVKMKGKCQDFLAQMCRNSDEAAKLSDKVLANELLETVWANMDMSSWESSILDEAIHRLRKQSNNAVRGAAEPRTLDGLVGHSESKGG
jgi:hypothetical protein